jgi:hypothetical protein
MSLVMVYYITTFFILDYPSSVESFLKSTKNYNVSMDFPSSLGKRGATPTPLDPADRATPNL